MRTTQAFNLSWQINNLLTELGTNIVDGTGRQSKKTRLKLSIVPLQNKMQTTKLNLQSRRCFQPITCKCKVGRDYGDLLLQVEGRVKIIFGYQEISLLEEPLQTVVDRLQCLQIYIHIRQDRSVCKYVFISDRTAVFANIYSYQTLNNC